MTSSSPQVVDLLDGGLQQGRLDPRTLHHALTVASQLWHAERPWKSRLKTWSRRNGWLKLLEAHPHATPESPPMLLMAYQGSSPCGMILGVPALIRLHKTLLPAHWGVDFYVPASQRARGLGEALLSAWHARSPLALGLGIADPAWPLAARLGWVRAASVTRLSRPLASQPTRSGPWHWSGPWHREGAALWPGLGHARLWHGVAPRLQPLLQALPGLGMLHCERSDAWLDWRYPGTRRALSADYFPGLVEQRFISLTLDHRPDSLTPAPQRLVVLEILCRGPLSRVMRIHEVLSALPIEQDQALAEVISHVVELARAWRMERIDVRTALPALEQLFLRHAFLRQSPPTRLEDPTSGAAADRFVLNPAPSLGDAARMAQLQEGPWYLSLGDSGNVATGLW